MSGGASPLVAGSLSLAVLGAGPGPHVLEGIGVDEAMVVVEVQRVQPPPELVDPHTSIVVRRAFICLAPSGEIPCVA